MPQLAPRFPSSDRTLLRTRSRLQSDCSIPNKIQPQVPTKIRTPTLPLEASLMLIVPPVELCPGGQFGAFSFDLRWWFNGFLIVGGEQILEMIGRRRLIEDVSRFWRLSVDADDWLRKMIESGRWIEAVNKFWRR
ncbi:Uncharacterized protein Fot_14589 [Forsythia ovata]|uniref:Uncharacterized protein n=1 Tax=Forsythia ovata TaxID=205694 RepID=A0ABD1W6R2_9LAMI